MRRQQAAAARYTAACDGEGGGEVYHIITKSAAGLDRAVRDCWWWGERERGQEPRHVPNPLGSICLGDASKRRGTRRGAAGALGGM